MAHPYDYYRKLITSEYRYKPNFMQWVKYLLTYDEDEISSNNIGVTMKSIVYTSSTGVKAKLNDADYPGLSVTLNRIDYSAEKKSFKIRNEEPVESTATDLINAFNIDTSVGPQLDIIGRIVGMSRVLKFQPSNEISPVMDDKTYRLCIKAKLIQNQWKGSAADLEEQWRDLFPETAIFEIQDLQDMSFNIVVSGNFTPLMQEIITNGYIIPKPEGVRINTLTIVDLEGFPLFSYEYETLYMAGYGSHWATNASLQGG